MTSKTTTERFWQHVRISGTDACWGWTSAVSIHGYGRFKVNDKMIAVHRYSYWLAYGELPTNLDICHKCNNRRCVNPVHLYAGTAKENVADAIKAGTHHNFVKTRTSGLAPKGESQPKALLIESQVLDIYRRCHAGESHRAIAAEYGVGKTTITNIHSGRSWGWLTQATA